MILPFDAHNHVHMGPTPPSMALLPASAVKDHQHEVENSGKRSPPALSPTLSQPAALSGMAIMSTHPRDFARVRNLKTELPQQTSSGHLDIVSCYGVHPWFLHELDESQWGPSSSSTDTDPPGISDTKSTQPQWLNSMEQYLQSDPSAIVGEVGLDGFHFDPITNELVSTMDDQVHALELQLQLARKLQRPVSIHTVQCFGPLMTLLSKMAKRKQLPTKMYFHAFGGKVGTVDQLLALCERQPGGKAYFGFAPIISKEANQN